MGEVYRARDTRLDRTVAIKVLPEHVAADPDLKQRFEREARTVAALNHPHICTLHDIGSQDGVDFLVMEYLDGETLQQRLEKGALRLDQALTVAIEIADALDKAHRQGIVHRDLKPGNIMLTKAGAKLLDFGLAKLQPVQQAGALSALPTQPADITREGSILGTFQYMAPEQLEGQEADSRTDIFAFGAVVYEMVTGKKAFEGKSQASLIASIMHVDPPAMSSLQVTAPPALDHVIKTCLIKDPERRWQTAGDVGRQLQWIRDAGPQGSRATAAAPGPQHAAGQHVSPAVVGAVVAGVVIGAAEWVLKPQTPPAPRPVVRFAVTPPALTITSSTVDAISPDGSHIVNGTGPQDGGLVVRALDQLEATRYQDLGPASSPFMSPDSASIGFASSASGDRLPSASSGGVLQRVSVSGGPAVTICPLPGGPAGVGASWGSDDTIIFGTGQPSGLWRVSAGGGEPQLLTTPDTELGDVNHNWPDILPGGRAVLFTVIPAGLVENAQIAVLDLETRAHTVLISGGSHPRYSPSGHIVYGAGGTLRAVGFDLDRLEVTSNAFPVLDGVSTKSTGAANFGLSREGTLVYVPSTSDTQRSLVWVDREEPLALDPGAHNRVRVSPDGSRVAVEVSGPDTQDVWVSSVTRGNLSLLTPGVSREEHPLWTPDGDRVVFRSNREGSRGLFWKAADGRGAVEPLLIDERTDALSPHDWSPDRRELIFSYVVPNTGRDIGVLAMEGERSWRPLLDSAANEGDVVVSPNGRWLAYASDETGQSEVYVERFPDLGNREQVSTDGGRGPVWSRDGSELFYLDLSGSRMLVLPLDSEPSLTPGTPAVAFEGAYRQAGTRTYDLAPDGRFVMITLGAGSIVVVENWLDELRRLVPTS